MYLNTNTNTFEKYFKYFFKYIFRIYYYIGKRNKTIYQAVHLVYCYYLSYLVTFSGLVSIWLLPSVQCSLLPSSLQLIYPLWFEDTTWLEKPPPSLKPQATGEANIWNNSWSPHLAVTRQFSFINWTMKTLIRQCKGVLLLLTTSQWQLTSEAVASCNKPSYTVVSKVHCLNDCSYDGLIAFTSKLPQDIVQLLEF